MIDANDWDGKTPMTTTHRTDEMTIINKIVAMIENFESLPSWAGSNSRGWTNPRSAYWNQAAEALMVEHGITNLLLFHWFCDRAAELVKAKA